VGTSIQPRAQKEVRHKRDGQGKHEERQAHAELHSQGDMFRVTLDLSDNEPMFGAQLRSGIPGIEGIFGSPDAQPKGYDKKYGKKGLHKMTDGSRKKFMVATCRPSSARTGHKSTWPRPRLCWPPPVAETIRGLATTWRQQPGGAAGPHMARW